MSVLITAILGLIVLGLLIWLVQYLPIDGRLKQIIIVLLILVAVIWLLTQMGVV